eukprot:11035492-Alexandrium_andersonii.AAC.1
MRRSRAVRRGRLSVRRCATCRASRPSKFHSGGLVKLTRRLALQRGAAKRIWTLAERLKLGVRPRPTRKRQRGAASRS